MDILIPENLSAVVSSYSSSITVGNSTLIPLRFNIPSNHSLFFYNSSIIVGNSPLGITFEVREPVARVLFDESFNRIARHGFTTIVEEILGDASNTIGMYSSFVQFLSYDNNYSVTPHIYGNLTYNDLIEFDVVILANPFSLASDIYMDWVENPGGTFLTIPDRTIQSLYDYVENGGGLLLLSTDSIHCNLTDFNSFLSNFDLSLREGFNLGIHQSTVINPQNWVGKISQIPHHGNFIQTSGTQTVIIAEYNNNPTLASFENNNGGRVLLFASDIIFDNIGFSDHAYLGNTENNKVLTYNAVAWLAEGEFREVSEPNNGLLNEILLICLFLLLLITLFMVLSSINKN